MSRNSITRIVIVAAVVGALVGGYVAYSVMGWALKGEVEALLAGYGVPSSGQVVQTAAGDAVLTGTAGGVATAETGGPLDAEERIVTDVYRRLSPSVVHVSTIQYYRTFFFQIVPQEGTGSGFIISEDGLVLTNNHVVAGAHEITVRLHNGEEHPAELVGTDTLTDLALLRVDGASIPRDWIAPLGDSDELQVGQRAIAIGNPFGLDSTVTVGVISALNRPLTVDNTTFDNMIQTDASINPGNSGGPLIDSKGEVIGINTVILSQSGGSHGVGFAIPINLVEKITDDLIQYGRVRRPSPGFDGLNVTPRLAQELGLPVTYGVLVQTADRRSAAWQAGLRGGTQQVRAGRFVFYVGGDIIIALDGEKVESYSRLADRIRRMELGTEVTLSIMREAKEMDLRMVLTE